MIQRNSDTSYRHRCCGSDGDNDKFTSQYSTVRFRPIHTTYPWITEVRSVEPPLPLQLTHPDTTVKKGRQFQDSPSSLHYSDSDWRLHCILIFPQNCVTLFPKVHPKIPLIILLDFSWRKVVEKLMSSNPVGFFQAKMFGQNSIKLTTSDVDLFCIVQKYLQSTNTEFHIFSLPK